MVRYAQNLIAAYNHADSLTIAIGHFRDSPAIHPATSHAPPPAEMVCGSRMGPIPALPAI